MLVSVFLGAMLSPQSGKELAKNKNVRLEGQTWNITDTDTHTHTHTHPFDDFSPGKDDDKLIMPGGLLGLERNTKTLPEGEM